MTHLQEWKTGELKVNDLAQDQLKDWYQHGYLRINKGSFTGHLNRRSSF